MINDFGVFSLLKLLLFLGLGAGLLFWGYLIVVEAFQGIRNRSISYFIKHYPINRNGFHYTFMNIFRRMGMKFVNRRVKGGWAVVIGLSYMFTGLVIFFFGIIFVITAFIIYKTVFYSY